MAPKLNRNIQPVPRHPQSPAEPRPAIWRVIALASTFLTLAVLSSVVSQLNLAPLYGSIPSSRYHQRGITFSFLTAYIAHVSIKKNAIPFHPQAFIPLLAYYIPTIHYVLVPFSTRLGPRMGPLVMESLTCFPLLFLNFLAIIRILDNLGLQRYGQGIGEATPIVLLYIGFTFGREAVGSYLPLVIGSHDFLTRISMQMLLASIWALFCPRTLLYYAVPAMIHAMFSNPYHTSVATTRILNQLLGMQNYTLLARRDSVTGYISVLESHKDGFQVMRCDHSILGGEWLVTDQRIANGQTKRETIYPVFTMLEAVRLIEGPAGEVPESEKNALFIGLGIGTSPSAFISHGIKTTIVELDPVVHQFATDYFHLPRNHTAVIRDAVAFVAETTVSAPKSFDYIVHDVFTGGAEPTALFTYEFLKGLEGLMKDEGAIAINYAGDLSFPPPQIILKTIKAVFPTCRIFRDSDEADTSSESFVNMVVFCTKSTSRPITFRTPVKADFLGSLARREFIPPSTKLEMKFPQTKGENRWKSEDQLLKNNNMQIVEKYHPETAERHWQLMRTVLPKEVWELW